MRVSWLFLLGGPLIWAAHLAVIYGIASLGAVLGDARSPGVRIGVVLATLAAAAAIGGILWHAISSPKAFNSAAEDGVMRFWRSTAGLAAFVSFAAVLWQGLPAFMAG